LASSIQHACNEIVTDFIAHFLQAENLHKVCLAGGFFQNLLLTAHLENKFGSGQVFVPPAPGNAGTAVGAGLLFWHQQQQKPRSQTTPSVLVGPAFKPQEIKDVLDNSKTRYSLQNTETRKLDAAVELLQAGKIVAWYQGAAEFGPRALGNRSVLASPWAAFIKENLNDYIKHREWFRPFALAVPEEDCDNYFEASSLCRVMNSLAQARTTCDPTVRGFSLPDGRIRLHVVQRSSNRLFWQLLKRFGERSPAPILLNTSFNLFGEPLVVSPRDAIRSYFCSGIDALVIDNFVLSKHAAVQVVTSTPALAISEPVGRRGLADQ
jgi:carbamoyltransferase